MLDLVGREQNNLVHALIQGKQARKVFLQSPSRCKLKVGQAGGRRIRIHTHTHTHMQANYI